VTSKGGGKSEQRGERQGGHLKEKAAENAKAQFNVARRHEYNSLGLTRQEGTRRRQRIGSSVMTQADGFQGKVNELRAMEEIRPRQSYGWAVGPVGLGGPKRTKGGRIRHNYGLDQK